MNKELNKFGLLSLWSVQLGLTLVLWLISAEFAGAKLASSVLLGGLVYIIPNAYFASQLFKYQGARSAKQIVNSFYKGEALKIIISVVLFAMVFLFFKINSLAFFASYIMMLLTHWFSPWIIVNKQK